MTSRVARKGVTGKSARPVKKFGKLVDEDTIAPTPPTPAGGNMQQQKPQQTAGNNSTTAPSTQPSKPITTQMTGQAAKLADKMKSDPNLGNKQAMAGRVKSLIGTVGGQTKDSAMMTDLVAAQLVGQGDLDPNKIK
jgi:hypothetical protein